MLCCSPCCWRFRAACSAIPWASGSRGRHAVRLQDQPRPGHRPAAPPRRLVVVCGAGRDPDRAARGIPAYYVGELAFIFVLAIASVGLMLLTGFTGLVSLGHAAFLLDRRLCRGACVARSAFRFGISLALPACCRGAVGLLLGLPALRLTGLYLAIATLAFSAIVEHLFAHWKFLSAGETFLNVPNPSVFGVELGSGNGYYYVALALLAGCILVSLNLMRAPTGPRLHRAPRQPHRGGDARRRRSPRTKTIAFALSAAIAGLAGALYAHKISSLTAESFSVLLSLELLMMVVVGGIGSIKGAVLGARVPRPAAAAIARLKDFLPPLDRRPVGAAARALRPHAASSSSCSSRWASTAAGRKIKAYFQGFPIYRRATLQAHQGLHARRSACDEPAPRVEDLSLCVRRRARGRRRQLRGRAGRGLRHHRPQRRRQDHGLQRGHRACCSRARAASCSTARISLRLPPHGVVGARHRAHVPEHRTVRARHGARNLLLGRHRTVPPALRRDAVPARRARAPSARIARKVEDVIDFLDLARHRDSRWAACPMACARWSSSAARWRRSRSCCCSTSPRPGLNPEETERPRLLDRRHPRRSRRHRAHGRARHGAGRRGLATACW